MRKTFHVEGMHCKSCEKLLTMAVEDAGLKVVRTDHAAGIVEAEAHDDAKFESARKAIESEGYKIKGGN